jgi:hypothetical protein
LNDRTIRRIGLFNPGNVQRIVDMHMTGRWDFSAKIWQILVAQIWGQRFLADSPGLSPETCTARKRTQVQM